MLEPKNPNDPIGGAKTTDPKAEQTEQTKTTDQSGSTEGSTSKDDKQQ